MRENHTRRGAILIPFLLTLGAVTVALGGMVETSLLLNARSRLFNDAENTLLAAAGQYGIETTNFETLTAVVKDQYCGRIFLEAGATNLDFSRIGDNILILNSAKTIPLLFIPAGVPLNVTVAANVPRPVSALDGLVPLAVLEETPGAGFALGRTYVLKYGGGGGEVGNYGALALGGGGSSTFLENLKYGHDQIIELGEVVPTEPGNMKGATEEGIAYRIDSGRDVLLVIVTDRFPTGRGEIVVKGFAAFRASAANHKGEVAGEFITYRATGEADPAAPNYGLYTRPKLIFL